MNSRHAAALALLGWYLFTPPPGAEAPIAEWNHVGSFDTARECEAVSLGSLKKAKKEKNEKHLKQWLNAECIASDDPRLREK